MSNNSGQINSKQLILNNLFFIYGYSRCIEEFNDKNHMLYHTPELVKDIQRLCEETEELVKKL